MPLNRLTQGYTSSLDAHLLDGQTGNAWAGSLRGGYTLHGGGTISVSLSGVISWSQRFILMNQGRSPLFSPSGYFDINLPAEGTVVAGVGGTSDVTVTSDGIPMQAWTTLYYEIPVGSNNAPLSSNFRLVGYTATTEVPPNWVPLCRVNGDSGTYYFPNGVALFAGQSNTFNSTKEFVGNSNNTVSFVGSISGNTLTVESISFGTLRVGQRLFSESQYIQPNTFITALNSNSSGPGIHNVSISQTVASANMFAIDQYSLPSLRLTDRDTTAGINQPIGTLEFFGSDASGAGSGIKSYISSIASSADGDNSLVFGTSSTTSNAVERLRISPTGNVGIGTTGPSAKLHVSNPDAVVTTLISGTTRGVRIGHNSGSTVIEGVDNTGVTTYQPLTIGGSDVIFTTSNTERMRVSSSGIVKFLNGIEISSYAIENSTISATAATGTINYDVMTQSMLYYTTNASGNWTLNIRGNASTALNSLLAVGQSMTIVFMVTQGATAFYQTAFQIDGVAHTPRWQGGSAPTEGNASGIDVYSFSITKTAATPTYVTLATMVGFA